MSETEEIDVISENKKQQVLKASSSLRLPTLSHYKKPKKRGIGYTRKLHTKSKSAKKLEKASRKKNQQISNKSRKFSSKNPPKR